MDRGRVRRPDSFAEGEEDRRCAVLHDHYRRAPQIRGFHPQVLLHVVAPGDEEGRRGGRPVRQPQGQDRGRAALHHHRPLCHGGVRAQGHQGGALQQQRGDLHGPGGRAPGRDLCRQHSAGRLSVDAPGAAYAFVGPELKDPKYVGEGAGIAVRKGNSELVGELNKAIEDIRANGEYQKIQAKYFKSDIYGD
ncbi:transporter substrate-binding domain-containing protein [Pseudomonas protegens]|uniref:transporter substrate-binding domain-containing protein n=1 Tax=Pseudomonas protegens TaxID=380021 RepID=UPI0038577B5A